eukprot:TRINITY_DN13336_c0_g1_i1.p1 TRINITY_DN13336_c0_g1~~TRINITY_DN13336_c0_g1_i1.p1  ORF type:complete len:173 (+),score=11.25 TRINITY_DN13336_c0_g1_i1:37-555(+)
MYIIYYVTSGNKLGLCVRKGKVLCHAPDHVNVCSRQIIAALPQEIEVIGLDVVHRKVGLLTCRDDWWLGCLLLVLNARVLIRLLRKERPHALVHARFGAREKHIDDAIEEPTRISPVVMSFDCFRLHTGAHRKHDSLIETEVAEVILSHAAHTKSQRILDEEIEKIQHTQEQ